MQSSSLEPEATGIATDPTSIPVESPTTTLDPTPETEPEPQPEVERPKPRPWTKKPKTKTKKGKRRTTFRHGVLGRKWSWGHVNTFQPTTKWTVRGRLIRPTTRGTIPGCIYYAIKRIKRGSDRAVLQAAIEDGLQEMTIQPLFRRVQVELRLLAKLGVIKRTKHPKSVRSTR
jgi:hypothetical protein